MTEHTSDKSSWIYKQNFNFHISDWCTKKTNKQTNSIISFSKWKHKFI